MFALLAAALLTQPPADAPAEKDPPTPAKAKPAGPPEFEVQFANGSTLKQVVVLTESVAVTTKYGKLTIPVGDLRRVEVGKGEKAADTVEAVEYTARGKLDTTELKVRTAEFGESTVKLANLKGLRYTPAGGGSAELTIDAAKHGRPNWADWLDAGVDVGEGQPLEITAAGTVELMPHSPGASAVGPAGGGPPAMPPLPAEPGLYGTGAARVRWQSGQLVAKVGPAGKPFPVGMTYKGKATTAGRLFLVIAPNGFGTEQTGSYKVTVKAGG